MVRKPKYVREYKDRHGIMRLEFRKKGQKGWPLRQPLRSSEFWKDYKAALIGEIPPGVLLKNGQIPEPIQKRELSKYSLCWLVPQYRECTHYKNLAVDTKKKRDRIYNKLLAAHGHKSFQRLAKKHLLKMRDNMSDKPGEANEFIKAFRALYEYVIEYDVVPGITRNLAKDVGYLPPKNPDGYHTWTEDELRMFMDFYPVGTKPRLAFDLYLNLGQRKGDVVRLGPGHVIGDRLMFTQEKNRKTKPVHMDIPITAELKKSLDATPYGSHSFIETQYGKPYTKGGFGNWFKRKILKAGLPMICSAHGLRKACCVRLAEAGCTDHEIMGITGHKSLKEVQRYTKKVRQRQMAERAQRKLEEEMLKKN
jgi:integrase